MVSIYSPVIPDIILLYPYGLYPNFSNSLLIASVFVYLNMVPSIYVAFLAANVPDNDSIN
jgi:hypothetical protein